MAAIADAQVIANELERVDPDVPYLFDFDALFYNGVVKATDAETISNRDMRVPLAIRPGSNFGHFDPDGGDLGRGDGPVWDKGLIGSVFLKAGIEWTKKAEWGTDDSRKSVLNTFRQIMATTMKEFSRDVDSLCVSSDGSGILMNPSTVSIGTGTNGGDVWTAPATDGYGVRLLRFNLTVGDYATGLATKRGETKVNFYDLANRVVHTFPSIATAANTDKLVVSGLGAPPTSIFGVPYHHNNAATGTWLQLSRVTNPEVRANRVTASGALALPFPRLSINKIGDRVGIDKRTGLEAWMHPCQKQAYEELGQMITVLNQQPKGGSLDLYFGDNMQMAGATVREHYSWDKTRIDYIKKDLWRRCETKTPGFYDVDGKKIFEGRGNSGGIAAYQMIYVAVGMNLYLKNPAAGSYTSDLTIPTGY